jgi:hypothetical protein
VRMTIRHGEPIYREGAVGPCAPEPPHPWQ